MKFSLNFYRVLKQKTKTSESDTKCDINVSLKASKAVQFNFAFASHCFYVIFKLFEVYISHSKMQ